MVSVRIFFLISVPITQFLNVKLGHAKVQDEEKKLTHNCEFNGQICTRMKRSREIKLKVEIATHVKKNDASTCVIIVVVVYRSLQAMKK
jgi:hypothetical protein